MADLLALKTRIASELHRTDLAQAISDAINTAISYYRSSRFEFNELQATFPTVANQEIYTAPQIPDDIGQIDSLRATINGRLMVLEKWNWNYLQDINTTQNTSGQPWAWAWYAKSIFLYPVPNEVYTVLISYQQRLDPPISDSDGATVWTNQAEALIRACAKKLICRDVIYDDAGYQRNQLAETEALSVLKDESIQLQDEGGIEPQW